VRSIDGSCGHWMGCRVALSTTDCSSNRVGPAMLGDSCAVCERASTRRALHRAHTVHSAGRTVAHGLRATQRWQRERPAQTGQLSHSAGEWARNRNRSLFRLRNRRRGIPLLRIEPTRPRLGSDQARRSRRERYQRGHQPCRASAARGCLARGPPRCDGLGHDRSREPPFVEERV